jgi:hypothetical protein
MKIILALIVAVLVGCSSEKIYKRKEENGKVHYLKIKLNERKLSVISYFHDDKNAPYFYEVNECIVFDKSNWQCGNIHMVNDELFTTDIAKTKYVYK